MVLAGGPLLATASRARRTSLLDSSRDPRHVAQGRLPPGPRVGCYSLLPGRSEDSPRLPHLLPGAEVTRLNIEVWRRSPQRGSYLLGKLLQYELVGALQQT